MTPFASASEAPSQNAGEQARGGFLHSRSRNAPPLTDAATPTRTTIEERLPWLASTRSKGRATSASWPTSMPGRRRPPSAFSTTRASTTRSARSTRAPRPWTTWSRSRSAGSRSPRRRRTASGGPSRGPAAGVMQPHQHHRHAGPRRLHDRGRAQPARARRRGRGVRRRQRRRAAERDGVAPGGQVQRPPRRVHEQDGQGRRRLPHVRQQHEGAPRHEPRPDPVAPRRRGPPPRASSISSR